MRRSTLLAPLLLTAGLLAGCSGSDDPASPDDAPPVSLGWNRLAEPVPVDLPEGAPIRAPGSEGEVDVTKPVLVNFWASWCVPCREEMPLLADVAERDDVDVVGVSLDRFEKYAVQFLEEVQVGYPSWSDPEARYVGEYAPAVSPNGLPSTVLVVDGEAVASHIGEFSSAEDLSAERLAELAG